MASRVARPDSGEFPNHVFGGHMTFRPITDRCYDMSAIRVLTQNTTDILLNQGFFADAASQTSTLTHRPVRGLLQADLIRAHGIYQDTVRIVSVTPPVKVEPGVKMEPGVKVEPGVKREPGVKIEAGVKTEPVVKIEPGVRTAIVPTVSKSTRFARVSYRT